jgi:hypothetical protein
MLRRNVSPPSSWSRSAEQETDVQLVTRCTSECRAMSSLYPIAVVKVILQFVLAYSPPAWSLRNIGVAVRPEFDCRYTPYLCATDRTAGIMGLLLYFLHSECKLRNPLSLSRPPPQPNPSRARGSVFCPFVLHSPVQSNLYRAESISRVETLHCIPLQCLQR